MLLTKQETAESYYNGTTQPLREQDKTLVFAFAEAIEAAVLEKLCAGVEMPEAAALIRKTDSVLRLVKHPNGTDFDISKWDNLHTADQLRAYGAAQRLKALEDAAVMCENESCSCCWTEDATEMASHLQDQIRALKGEAP